MKNKKAQLVEPESVLGIPLSSGEYWMSELEHGGGTNIARHSHADFVQLIFITEGCASFCFEDRIIIGAKGSVVFIPKRAEHWIQMSRKTVLRTLSLFSYDKYLARNDTPYQFSISPLLKALSDEIVKMENKPPVSEEQKRLYQVFIDQLNGAVHQEKAVMLPQDPRVKKALYILSDHDNLSVTLAQICQKIGVGERTLTRLFIETTGMTFSENKRRLQMEYATLLIKDGMPIVHVALQTGYDTQSGFIHAFKNHVGMSPLQYKKQVLA
ncbi:MAG: AraC family transcriptional regulator [Ewingella americana]|uniref:AraC family transcriptional regulator n=1 Tax=Ewingella americana TaxID=41202 RepID=UPI002431852D|nr:helix-turn-helix domain-containing protein [Ewingella americana]MCI1679167.1 AraC family transcriptional regulator [Ewingella americana]MCI1852189.1 AraC family transcriptional regulator [Ewingella americana]MCI1862591.1 AraC family transcriptional regulator [Ewingella americana]MCI2142627.1 AraC family transcriptional regulator [Ewingella americana]MCI2166145.1 AraC family transcriptional regulator [Ewingella americana]